MPDEKIIIPPVTYGIWIPGKGWFRDDNSNVFGDLHLTVAQSVARRLGQGAHVEYIDPMLAAAQSALLYAEEQSAQQKESRTLWHILTMLLHKLPSRSTNSK